MNPVTPWFFVIFIALETCLLSVRSFDKIFGAVVLNQTSLNRIRYSRPLLLFFESVEQASFQYFRSESNMSCEQGMGEQNRPGKGKDKGKEILCE